MTRRRRATAAAAVAMAHLALLSGWLLSTARMELPRREAATQAPLVVRLLDRSFGGQQPMPPADRTTPPPWEHHRGPAESSTVRAPRPAAPPLDVPAAAAIPGDAAASPPVREVTPALAGAPEPPASSPLRLDLPRQGSRLALPSRHPALDDARVHAAAATMERRIGQAMALEWTEEPLGDGRVRYRRGDECIVVVPSRDGGLDPFNQAASQKPRGDGPC